MIDADDLLSHHSNCFLIVFTTIFKIFAYIVDSWFIEIIIILHTHILNKIHKYSRIPLFFLIFTLFVDSFTKLCGAEISGLTCGLCELEVADLS